MNWICVLEQAVAGTLVIGLVVCTGIGVKMVFGLMVGFIQSTEWAKRRAEAAQRRAYRTPSRPRTKFGKWWQRGGRDKVGNIAAAVFFGSSVLLLLYLTFGTFIIPLGRSVLNVAMGRECW